MENQESEMVEPVGGNAEVQPSKMERQWAMGCHLIALCGYIIPVPAANLIGPLVLWLIKREEGAFIDEQGKESLNFQISMLIYAIICFVLMFVAIGALLIVPLGLFGFVCVIIATIKASEGTSFRYPGCIRFIK